MLGERYVVQERVGAGGMATVYRGLDTFLHRQVALKILRPQFADDQDFVRRFRREARAAASLSHPNIVAVYDVGQEGSDLYYIVQEFINGRTLKERIVEEGSLDPRRALVILRQVLEALGHAHRAGVIHRDVKPQNVLLTQDGRVKVADFGIARAEIGTTGTLVDDASIVGTAFYAAPEQIKGRQTDVRSDIYSTGVMFYEMLCGHLPETDDDLRALGEPPCRLRPDEVPSYAAVLKRALAIAPEDRYASTDLFLADIQALSVGKPPALALAAPAEAAEPEAVRGEVGPTAGKAGNHGGERRRRTGGKQRPRKVRAGRIIGSLVGVVVVLGALLYGGDRLFMHWIDVPVVTIPAYNNTSLAVYESELTKLGLTYGENGEYSSSVTPENVVSVTPAAGTQVKKDFKIDILYSEGPQMITIPNLAGAPPATAESDLEALGFPSSDVVISPTEQYSTITQGYVVSTDPGPGASVAATTTVTITLSEGPAPGSQLLPDFVGTAEQAVQSQLTSDNVSLGTVTQQKGDWPSGDVLAQTPTQGTPLQPGMTVNLTVSTGCVYSQTLTETASAGTSDQNEAVTIQGLDSTQPARLLFNAPVPAGTSFSVQLCWASPHGAVWIWQENGSTMASGTVTSPGSASSSTSSTSSSTTSSPSSTSSSSTSSSERSVSLPGPGGDSGTSAG